MNRDKILENYKNPEERILVASILDKIELANKTGIVQNTDFLDIYQKALINKILKQKEGIEYFSFGGGNLAEREVIFFIPSKRKIDEEEKIAYIQDKIAVIRIIIPKEKYEHREYLGGILKLGVERKKIGDIIIKDNQADIIVIRNILEFLQTNLPCLTRFKNAIIQEIDINKINEKKLQFEEKIIQISSNRLDNIVSELACTSRNKAVQIIDSERVFINGKIETKLTKQIKEKDIITIRGKGKYIYDSEIGNTKSGRIKLKILKYI